MLARSQYTYAEDMGVNRVGQDKDVGDVALTYFLCEGVSVYGQYCRKLSSVFDRYRVESEHCCDVKVMEKDPV